MVYVAGSGPSGIACAWALVTQGVPVTMLDAGIELEPERAEIVARMSSQPPEAWNGSDIAALKENMTSSIKGIPLKYVYGSGYAYAGTEEMVPIESHGVDVKPSFARGGLSSVWGGALLPYRAEDMADWPIERQELDVHYEKVLEFMDFSGTHDDLAAIFPLYHKLPAFLEPSAQASALMRDAQRHREKLRQKGVNVGYARLAVRARSLGASPGCVYCGLCMYGCPYRLIFDASAMLTRLRELGNFTYLKDIVVHAVEEHHDSVRIRAVNRLTREPLVFDGGRVYLACGVLPTTKIVLESLGAYGQPVTMQDSQYFLLPLVRFRNSPRITTQPLHTLAQVFLEISDARISRHGVHLQIYTYNDLYLEALKNLTRGAFKLLNMPIMQLLGRLMIAQGYLHSRESSSATLALMREPQGGQARLVVTARHNPNVTKTIWKVIGKLFGAMPELRMAPMPLTLHIARPGRGFHSGGTFPMAMKPGPFQSDTLGRPYGFTRVHIVDASCFPSVPATTITFSVMANAHRIASAYKSL